MAKAVEAPINSLSPGQVLKECGNTRRDPALVWSKRVSCFGGVQRRFSASKRPSWKSILSSQKAVTQPADLKPPKSTSNLSPGDVFIERDGALAALAGTPAHRAVTSARLTVQSADQSIASVPFFRRGTLIRPDPSFSSRAVDLEERTRTAKKLYLRKCPLFKIGSARSHLPRHTRHRCELHIELLNDFPNCSDSTRSFFG